LIFLFKCLVVIALVYFAVNKDALSGVVASIGQERRAVGDNGAKREPLTELQRMAADKLVGAARDHCLATPADCLSLLKSAGLDARKTNHKDH
jgi:hypothetical protein